MDQNPHRRLTGAEMADTCLWSLEEPQSLSPHHGPHTHWGWVHLLPQPALVVLRGPGVTEPTVRFQLGLNRQRMVPPSRTRRLHT